MLHFVEHMGTIVRLEHEAYGATIRRDIETRTARRLSISAVYTTLDRLEQKGMVRSWIGEPTAEREAAGANTSRWKLTVSRRTREIGVRMALGGSRERVIVPARRALRVEPTVAPRAE